MRTGVGRWPKGSSWSRKKRFRVRNAESVATIHRALGDPFKAAGWAGSLNHALPGRPVRQRTAQAIIAGHRV